MGRNPSNGDGLPLSKLPRYPEEATRSGAEVEQHNTTPSAWVGGEGGKQAHGLEWTHDFLQER